MIKKNMKLGNRVYQFIILFFFIFNFANAEEKIELSPEEKIIAGRT